ncbi:Ig-like domain repeat protein [Cellulomonas sp. HD19AZ1]|uniref:Ig-like domain repeat protein n=1 Tax=Cellulomonas sp. HD19AZ1 TaxID=2559593 RepID=UPI00107155CA|nr:Ig-like domain repeat protein [Cellulomonas sp. HD19AZ1]TFH68118.1 Ig-like domain repeat protein [Cellulomonas sp. HD19AZ1]
MATLAAGVGIAGTWWAIHPPQQIPAQSAAAPFTPAWTAQRDRDARAQVAGRRAAARSGATALSAAAHRVLEGSRGQVVDEQVRVDLAAAVAHLRQSVAGGGPDDWSFWSSSVVVAVKQVVSSKEAWQQAEAERVAAEQAAAERAAAEQAAAEQAAAARAAEQAAAERGSGKAPRSADRPSAGAEAPPAAPARPVEQAPSTERFIRPGRVSWDSGSPGTVTVSVTTGGVTGPVVVTIAGSSITVGVGSGTFSGTLTGLPAGSHTWTASVDGLVATSTATVP